MFSRHYRKVKAIFGLTGVFLVSLAFLAAYQTRIRLPGALSDTFPQCLLGAVGVVIAEYLLRLDLSRFFVARFAACSRTLPACPARPVSASSCANSRSTSGRNCWSARQGRFRKKSPCIRPGSSAGCGPASTCLWEVK